MNAKPFFRLTAQQTEYEAADRIKVFMGQREVK